MNTTRAAIAAALSTVAGVKGYAKAPTAFRTGDAWPNLTRLDRGPGDVWEAQWRVFVVLPGSDRDAVDQIDALLPSLVAALDPVIFVDAAEPVTIPTDAGDLPALQITARSE